MNTEPDFLVNIVSMILYFLVMMIVETLYVAGGFALYLNRRIILEGWDIELIFRKLKQRHDKQPIGNLAMVVGLFVLSLFSGVYPVDVQAASVQSQKKDSSTAYEHILPPIAELPLAPEASERIIKEVMADPVFNRIKKVERLEYIGPDKDKKDKKDLEKTQSWLTDVFEAIGHTIAFIFEVGLWILLLVAIFLLVKYRDRLNLGLWKKSQQPLTELSEMLFGLDLREESLPDDVPAQALQFFQEHNYRAALALLYRATLAYLVKHYEFTLEKGATEGDCLELVSNQLSLPSEAEVNYFIELTRAWQLTAYGHRDIPAEQMKQLCLNWSSYYRNNKVDSSRDGEAGDE